MNRIRPGTREGFSLIEIRMVVMIIRVLATVVLVSPMATHTMRAKASASA